MKVARDEGVILKDCPALSASKSFLRKNLLFMDVPMHEVKDMILSHLNGQISAYGLASRH